MRGHVPFQWWAAQLRPALPSIGVTLLLSVGIGAIGTVDPLLMRYLIDRALPSGLFGGAALTVLAIGFCYLLRSALGAASSLLTFRITQQLGQQLRTELLTHMSALSADWHERTPLGEKLSRYDQDVEQIAQFISDSANSVLRAVVLFVANLVVMFWLNRGMTLSVMALLPLFLYVRARYRRRMEGLAARSQAKAGKASGVLTEYLSAVPQIQLLTSVKAQVEAVRTTWLEMMEARWRQRRTEVAFSAAISGILAAAILFVLGAGIWEYKRAALTIGGLVAFYAYTTRIFEPLSTAMELYSRSQRITASASRVVEVLDTPPSVPDRGKLFITPSGAECCIHLDRVWFSYSENTPVLRNVSLHIRSGQRVALIGPSGSGKSTLSRLLVRLADPDSGAISLGLTSLTDYSADALRRSICYVPQHPKLFSGTIRENILFGNDESNDADLQAVIDAAQLRSVVELAPNGLETVLREEAAGLSGGERLRVALARALLRNPDVLILDESTAALDLPLESAVLQSIAAIRNGGILIVVSHRIRSVTWVDKMVLLESGTIQAQGSHDELYRENALYRSLYEQGEGTVR